MLNNSLDTGYLSYDTITLRALDYTAKRFGIQLADEARERLLLAWTRLRLWPEAAEVLSEIQNRGYAIAILSNGTEAMLQALQEEIGIHFDYIFFLPIRPKHINQAPKFISFRLPVSDWIEGNYCMLRARCLM